MNVKKVGSANGRNRGSVALIATFVVAMMVAASASLLFVGGDNNHDADDTVFGSGPAIDISYKDVSEIQDEIQGAINKGSAGSGIKVNGEKDDADVTLYLFIPKGMTVTWNAEYEGNVPGAMIHINSASQYGPYNGNFADDFSGTFRVTGSGTICNISDGGIALSVDHGNVMTAGVIESGMSLFSSDPNAGQYGIGIEVGEGNVTVTGGSVNALWAYGIGIRVGEGNVTVTGGDIFVDEYGAGIYVDKGNVTMTGGAVYTWNPGVAGIRITEGSLNMTGGSISTTNNFTTAILLGSPTTEGYATIRGGSVTTGTHYAIHVVNGAAVYLEGTVKGGFQADEGFVADEGFIVCATHYY
ncbi:MAG: hypothetical protein LBE47_03200, partial [Methanomassiliicoccaceae archaeon]|nr:hypothetical protein [Methanomassiliicoccaceae archaeon]